MIRTRYSGAREILAQWINYDDIVQWSPSRGGDGVVERLNVRPPQISPMHDFERRREASTGGGGESQSLGYLQILDEQLARVRTMAGRTNETLA